MERDLTQTHTNDYQLSIILVELSQYSSFDRIFLFLVHVRKMYYSELYLAHIFSFLARTWIIAGDPNQSIYGFLGDGSDKLS
jgi:superfamily I DNA/RNA helicase